jgi:hypothetical protein
MAWTTPRTWIPYELVTDTMLNTHIRDNFNVVARVSDQLANRTGVTNTGATFSLLYLSSWPAGFLSVDGDTVEISVAGQVAANTNNKQINIYLQSQPIGSVGTALASVGFSIDVTLRRTGADTSIARAISMVHSASAQTSILGPTINWAAAATLEVYGLATTTGDILLHSAIVEVKRRP